MSLTRRVEAWERNLTAGLSTTLVAEVHGAVVGFADYGPARDEDLNPHSDAELNALYVHPEHWSRGFGFGLWSNVQSLLLPTDFSNVVLWVLEGNLRGRDFYERQGCRLDPMARKLWRPEAEALVEIRYARPLSASRAGMTSAGRVGEL
jgi:ribosomal protein S18 acetylase RimI-like enzyme